VPVLFHALIFAAVMHRDFMRWGKIFPDSPCALSHKLAVIQRVKEAFSNGEDISRDEVILAILILSSHDLATVPRKREPFTPPLQSGSWLNIYGNTQQVPEHIQVVMSLVSLRGGVENLRLKGLAEIIGG
jgi:hypothetical protein